MSPEKPPVKVTYANKKRRGNEKGKVVEESEASGCEAEHSIVQANSGEMNLPASRPDAGPVKRVDPLELPGPVPRGKGAGLKERKNEKGNSPHTPKSKANFTNPSSTLSSSFSLAANQSPPTPDSAGKLVPDFSDKENSSRAARTTEAERRAYYEAHPDVAGLEPHRVRCRCCDKWLKLSTTQNYALAPWKLHKKACTSEKPCTKRSRLSLDAESLPFANGEDDDDASSIAPSVSVSEATCISVAGRRLSALERQRILQEDELTDDIRPDAVYCSSCAKWIKLSSRIPYQLRNWTTHAERMHDRARINPSDMDSGPSNRVREAERKLQLVNDVEVRDFSPSRLTCKACSAEVVLSETIAYQLDNWLAHKDTCSVLSSSVKPSPESLPSASDVTLSRSPTARAPPSSTSTEATCVATESATRSGSVVIGQKRPRENDETEEGEPETVRVRTTSYVAPDLKPSGPWGWLKLPWETFKRGFAEGLGTSRGSATLDR